jgi:hypothetical protein
MKKTNKPKAKVIKELAVQFEEEFKKSLPITVLKNGSIAYNDYLIKQTTNENWGVYRINSEYLLEEYHLKTCALLAAKAYSKTDINKFFEIKHLDNKYWANFSDLQVYKKNIKLAKEFDRFCILLNKLEDTEHKTNMYKEQISKMFKYSFV